MNKANSQSILQRGDIEEKYTWNLAELYADNENWENDFRRAEELIEKAKIFVGTLAQSPAGLYACLETQSQLSLLCANLHQYARLNQDLDSRQSKFQALTDRAAMLSSRAQAAFAFVEPELLTIDEKRLAAMEKDFPRRGVYDFYLADVNRSRAHIRSAEIEEILAQATVVARGPARIFAMFDGADIDYPEVKNDDGKTVKLTKQRFMKLMDSSRQETRREAYERFNQPYAEAINTLGATLASSVNKDMFYSRARRYKSCLHMALDTHNIPTSVYHTLVDTTENNLDGLHDYLRLRKKILGLDQMYPCDAFCPLFPDQDYDIPYEKAVSEISAALAPLGKEYIGVLKRGLSERWVDVNETEGKRGGAYSSGNYLHHPFVLMNYNNTVSNMFTLAHEMGHALHSYLSCKKQPYPKHQYSIFVAEVASTVNEGLLLDYLLNQTGDVNRRIFLIYRELHGMLGTYFHQVLFAHFELDIHTLVEQGQALSPDIMNRLMEDLTRKYYGTAVTMDEFTRYKWSRIPHFYESFYVYQYATSYAASKALLRRFLGGDSDLLPKYLNLLSSGGSDYPINQLRTCGLDLTTPAPFEAALARFADLVNELESLWEARK